MSIIKIAFDGIHRCGKGTQIQMLQDFARQNNIHTISIRGEHYRNGNGNNAISDPLSSWRQKNKTTLNYDMKSNRLNRELYYFYTKFLPQYLKNIGVHQSLVIQDRSIAGKYMFNSSIGQDIVGIDKIPHGKHEAMKHQVIVPDLIFVLQPSQEELLARLENGYDPSQENAEFRHIYKKDYIEKKYHDYYGGLSLIPQYIKKNIHHIKSDAVTTEVHKEILEILENSDIFEGGLLRYTSTNIKSS